MTSYYESTSKDNTEYNSYVPIERKEVRSYDLKSLIDTEYYKEKNTKITAETYVYIRKTN